jgi:DNA-binding transcriptional regulator YiaG
MGVTVTTHPNRSKGHGESPTSEAVYLARFNVGLTIPEAARLVCVSARAWENWETKTPSHRPMPPAAWELFLIKTGQMPPPEPIKK